MSYTTTLISSDLAFNAMIYFDCGGRVPKNVVHIVMHYHIPELQAIKAYKKIFLSD